jgi:alpha-ketoglutarate-dependent taurine dioxygenase
MTNLECCLVARGDEEECLAHYIVETKAAGDYHLILLRRPSAVSCIVPIFRATQELIMPTRISTDPRAWRADTIDDPSRWYYPLSEPTLAAQDRAIGQWRQGSEPVTSLRASDGLRAAAAEDVQRILMGLETGRGFAVVTAGPPGRYSPQELPAVYWLVGELLGRPFEQNVQGTLLYDVRDAGQDVRYGARFSVTNAESSFHTDNSFGDDVLDYVGLLCLNAARSGGRSQIVSGYAVRDELLARHADAFEILCQPFHVDRRGGLRPGDEPTARFPVFGGDEVELLIRYLRYWIEVGHEKVGAPLTAQQLSALDALDRVAGDPGLRVEFDLRPGEMLFVNNRWILHNRTAFEDHPEPERRRHYVRLWLQTEEGRGQKSEIRG